MKCLNESLVDELLISRKSRSALVLDADRTLSVSDSGRMVGEIFKLNDSIRAVFEENGYTPFSMVEVSKIWATVPEYLYLRELNKTSACIEIQEGWMELLPSLMGRVQIVVATAGFPQLWKAVLSRVGLGSIPVFGGCRYGTDAYVVCPEGKASVVRVLQHRGHHVTAVGDSLMDLKMLEAADSGLVALDERGSPHLIKTLMAYQSSLRHIAFDGRETILPRITSGQLGLELLGRKSC